MQRTRLTFEQIQKIPFLDENGNEFLASDPNRENVEQYIANQFVSENDCIIELGARFGTVSCVANNKLKNPYNHIAIEPDVRVLDCLNKNRANHNSYFFIFDGIISNEKKYSLTKLDDCRGYGATSIENEKSNIPIISLKNLEKCVFAPFTCLIADCEGFLETFLFENLHLLKTLKTITYEKDGECDYDKIDTLLKENGFKKTYSYGKHHFVFQKPWYNPDTPSK